MKDPIILDENYSLRSDGKQWILDYKDVKQVPQKDGPDKTVTSTDQFFVGSISRMLQIYSEKALKNCEAKSIKELSDKVDDLMKLIDNLFHTVGIPDKAEYKNAGFAVDPPEDAADDDGDSVENVLGDMF